ncbi:hypothetical protein BJY01DRAFT_249944 [Aspergillus pseudoustus]|uniref:Uncharacterized protein n=1 Tax=Aspergillus pseudoustus TaxID=1810923 RepID=A0ABR4JKL5_9EURO
MESKLGVRRFICGLEVIRGGEPGDRWLQEPPHGDGTYLSNASVRRRVGDEATFQVTLSTSSTGNGQNISTADIPILKDSDGYFGFVMHNACWHIFQIRTGSTTFDLRRLAEDFESYSRFKGLHSYAATRGSTSMGREFATIILYGHGNREVGMPSPYRPQPSKPSTEVLLPRVY